MTRTLRGDGLDPHSGGSRRIFHKLGVEDRARLAWERDGTEALAVHYERSLVAPHPRVSTSVRSAVPVAPY
eukprot:527484-Rhodomonas_salina.3